MGRATSVCPSSTGRRRRRTPTVASAPATTSVCRSSGKNSGASTVTVTCPGSTGTATPTPSRGISRPFTRTTALAGMSGTVTVSRPTRGRTAVSSLLATSRVVA